MPYKTYKERREEQLAKRRQRWEQSIPDSWLQRKSAIGIAGLLLAYVVYVYIHRVTVPMIQQSHWARGSRTEGIVLLSIFLFGFLMTVWVGLAFAWNCRLGLNTSLQCYIRILTKGPGYLKDARS
jgi:hypothetical protein